jgi:hypothetical protein
MALTSDVVGLVNYWSCSVNNWSCSGMVWTF